MTNAQHCFQQLYNLSRQNKVLKGISSLLDWDQKTYMPSGAAENRANQLKILAGITHREKTSLSIRNLLSQLIDLETGTVLANDLSLEQQFILKEWHREYLQNSVLPTEFVEELTKLQSQAIAVWHVAKKENDFQKFAPFLERLVLMNRQKADLIGYTDHPYDALLDKYAHGMTTEQVTHLFESIKNFTISLLAKIKSQTIVDDFLYSSWDSTKQMAFAQQMLDAVGYSQQIGRVDFSAHPFLAVSHPTDSRITTRLHEKSLIKNLLFLLHETGHALYETGLPIEHFGTALGEHCSIAIHESQSKWWETHIGLSEPFWHHFYPILQKTFQPQLEKITFHQFYHAINKVQPSFIRLEADEVTYPLHVVLRFELEKDLIAGNIRGSCEELGALKDGRSKKLEIRGRLEINKERT